MTINFEPSSIDPEVQAAAEQELKSIMTKYGLTQEQTTSLVAGLKVDHTEGELGGQLQEFNKILQNPNLPAYIQVHLNEGDSLLNTTVDKSDGYKEFYLNRSSTEDLFPEQPTQSNQRLVDRSQSIMSKLASFSNRNSSLRVAALRNLNASGQSALALEYPCGRPDRFGRTAPVTIFILFNQQEIATAVDAIKTADPNEATRLVQERIDPDLKNVAPANHIEEISFADITISPGTSWQQLSSVQIQPELIKQAR